MSTEEREVTPVAGADPDPRWLDDARNVDKVVHGLYVVCALLVVVDLVDYKHAHYGFENWIGFYCFYGLVCCVALVLAAKAMRVVLKRDEDYYE